MSGPYNMHSPEYFATKERVFCQEAQSAQMEKRFLDSPNILCKERSLEERVELCRRIDQLRCMFQTASMLNIRRRNAYEEP